MVYGVATSGKEYIMIFCLWKYHQHLVNIFRFSPATHNNHFPQVTREGCDALSAAVAARLALLDAASRVKDQVRNGWGWASCGGVA